MVQNITFNADEFLVKKARLKAERENKSLNSVFREWLSRYIHQDAFSSNYRDLMKSLKNARAGQKFTRDELNER